jgi:microcystin-dependent protein
MAKIEVGTIILWSGNINSPPDKWAVCNGSNGTPDLRNRFVVGAGNSYAVNSTGGSDSVTLSTAELPSHTHGLGTIALGLSGTNHTHSQVNNFGNQYDYMFGTFGNSVGTNYTYEPSGVVDAGGHTHSSLTGNTASAGSGQAHENRPAYRALAYIMKVA